MKRSVFLLMVALSVTLTGCSMFDSAPVKPDIIGTGNLQYDTQHGLWFTVIDSTQYTITSVTIPDYNPHSFSVVQSMEPVEGMLVTVFNFERQIGIQAVAGRLSEQQIEDMYHENYGAEVIILSFILICIIAIFVYATKTDTAINNRIKKT